MSKEKIIQAIDNSQRILVTAHINPDGDAIGSELAMAHALKQMGKEVIVCNKDEVPMEYLFLSEAEQIKLPDQVDNHFDLLIVLDCGHFDRIGTFALEDFKLVVNIDHHATNNAFGDINWFRSDVSSTAELVFELLLALPVTITPEIATCIYTGILTDTGSFHYSNTIAKTFQLAAKLVEYGVDPAEVAMEVYETMPLTRVRLLGESLKTMEIFGNGAIASMLVTQKMLEECNAKPSDTDNFVNYPRGLRGVNVAIFWRQMDEDLYKVSFRSKIDVDVANVADKFNGGGHFHAAGAYLKGNLEDLKHKVVHELNLALQELEMKEFQKCQI